MKLSDLVNEPGGTVFRLLSLSGFALSPAVFLLMAHNVTIHAMLFAAAVSFSVLLLPHSKKTVVTAFVMEILSVVLDAGFALAGRFIAFALLYYLLSILPLVGSSLRESMEMAMDDHKFVTSVSGWEAALNSSRMLGVMVWSIALPVLFVISCLGKAGEIVSFVAILLPYIWMSFRGCFPRGRTRPATAPGDTPVRKLAVATFNEAALPSRVYRTLFGKMTAYMDREKPYLDSGFSLDDMARAIGSNRGYVSRMINTCTGMNFCQFVNGYRIRYALSLMENEQGKHNMLDIAYRSGFNNRPSFNMAFKLYVNMTPGEWMRERENAAARQMQEDQLLSIGQEQEQSPLPAFFLPDGRS